MSLNRFGTPRRFTTDSGEVVFEVPIKAACQTPLGLCLSSSPSSWTREEERRFLHFRELVLRELAVESGLFRNPPTFKTLEGMTTHWLANAKTLKPGPPTQSFDLVLQKLQISRSRIEPLWHVKEVSSTIDFDWGSSVTQSGTELEEVSDVPVSAGGEAPFVLTDPVAKARAKMAAKTNVRQLFAAANNARLEAETAAAAFLDTYDLSDTESTFSEWMSADEESGDDERLSEV